MFEVMNSFNKLQMNISSVGNSGAHNNLGKIDFWYEGVVVWASVRDWCCRVCVISV